MIHMFLLGLKLKLRKIQWLANCIVFIRALGSCTITTRVEIFVWVIARVTMVFTINGTSNEDEILYKY